MTPELPSIGNCHRTSELSNIGQCHTTAEVQNIGKHHNVTSGCQAQELIDQDTFEIHCLGHSNMPPKKLCLIAFLPHILDDKAAGRRAHIRVITLNELYGSKGSLQLRINTPTGG